MVQERFLTQSYEDALKDFNYSITSHKSAQWDYVFVTASNEKQAEAYRIQIKNRQERKLLPEKTEFIVVSDIDGKRIGSGGATFNIIKVLADKIGVKEIFKKKMLVIHSGGDSKRVPQYSACGKLFSPVPRCILGGRRTTIFDELLIMMSGIVPRCSSGMLIVPSDTVMLFNPLQVDLLSCDAAGLSIKAGVLEGKEHGVFLDGEDGELLKFLHKQSEATLKELGAVDSMNNVNIDTGCIWFGSRIIEALTGLISDGNKIDDKRFNEFVNDKVRLSFYADLVYPLAKDCTIDEYFGEIPEGSFSDELHKCREEIWGAISNFKMKVIKMLPAKYIHFGTTQELFNLMVWNMDKYSYLGWEQKILTNVTNGGALSNAIIKNGVQLSEKSYIEDSILGSGTVIGDKVIVSGISLENVTIPNNCVLHGLKLVNGKFVCRIYGINDNPKNSMEGTFLASSIKQIKKYTGIGNEELWQGSLPSIWTANIYPECDSMQEAVDMAIILYNISDGTATDEEKEKWINSKKYSLCDSFNLADTKAILDWQKRISEEVHAENFIKKLSDGEYSSDAIAELYQSENLAEEVNYILEFAKGAQFPLNMRIYLAIADLCKKDAFKFNDNDAVYFEDKAYDIVKNYILDAIDEEHKVPAEFKFVKDEVIEECPVRVNFCGSPSDAAPYCLEHGGTMIDGTILLEGKLPIRVEVKKIDEPCVEFVSGDLNGRMKFYDMKELRSCENPYDTFALHKAVLLAAGITSPKNNINDVSSLCEKIGGGISMATFVDIPKGSGLGTSSILAAGCLKAVNEIFGLDTSARCIYAQVFAVEQLMSTGGGWQDQVGGFTPGIKFFQSRPGAYQDIKIDYLDLNEDIRRELQDRFVLIFSGQRRLARNVLREEMNQCIRNNPEISEKMELIRQYCALMKYELERGNITGFAQYITKQFELIKTIDKGASNTCIEYIFDVCDDLIDGKSICGAGGGGFLMVVLKEGVSKDLIKERIRNEFMDCGISVWDSTFIY